MGRRPGGPCLDDDAGPRGARRPTPAAMYAIPFLDIPPLRSAAGRVRLPGSKSISNRVLLLAGLAAGTTAVHGLLDSDDTGVMLAALEAPGRGARRPPHAAGRRVRACGGGTHARAADRRPRRRAGAARVRRALPGP